MLISLASRGLRPTKRNMSNYSSMKVEFLVLKWAQMYHLYGQQRLESPTVGKTRSSRA